MARSDGFRLRDVLKPRDGAETAAWTGVFVFVLAIAVAVLLVTVGGSSGPKGPVPGRPGSVASGTPSGPLDDQGVWNPYLTVRGGGAGASAASRKLWGPVAQEFVEGFLGAAHDPHWLARLKPVVSPQLLRRLRWVTRSDVPSGTPGSTTVRASGDHTVDVTVGIGGRRALGVELVDLPHDGRSWMVYGYEDRSVS